MNKPVRWFRFFTVPVALASVGTTIAAAELASPDLMLAAAGLGGVGVISLLVGRNIINRPDAEIKDFSVDKFKPFVPLEEEKSEPKAAAAGHSFWR